MKKCLRMAYLVYMQGVDLNARGKKKKIKMQSKLKNDYYKNKCN